MEDRGLAVSADAALSGMLRGDNQEILLVTESEKAITAFRPAARDLARPAGARGEVRCRRLLRQGISVQGTDRMNTVRTAEKGRPGGTGDPGPGGLSQQASRGAGAVTAAYVERWGT